MNINKVLITIPLLFLSVSSFAILNADNQILRLNVLSDLDGKYSVEKVKICSTSKKCLSYNLNKNVHLLPKKNGDANFIGAISVPIGSKINYIDFENSVKNKNGINGRLNLAKPLTIEEHLNYQALFGLRNISSSLYPATVNTHYYRKGLKTLFYNPTSALKANLDKGVTLKIPAHALKEPQIFTVAIHDVGQKVPMVDLLPYIELEKNFTLSFSQSLRKGQSTNNSKGAMLMTNRTQVFDEGSFSLQTL
ncbi:hypothetical protein [uncultured Psychrobacter sp.]|uniref:hypothetical protein n=1 Tax=uncultured Psychrobacter sp. TaxID=259303 RepID=UPI00345A85BB